MNATQQQRIQIMCFLNLLIEKGFKMKRLLISLLTIFFMVSLSLVAYAIHEIIPSETQIPEPGPDAEKLNEYNILSNTIHTEDGTYGQGKESSIKEQSLMVHCLRHL